MSRVLITGAGGFIGRHTLEPLLDAGFEVHAITSSKPPSDVPAAVCWHRSDLLEPGPVGELMDELRPSHLLHLAWYIEPPAHVTAPINLDWVQASIRLLRAFGETGGLRALLLGTAAEYTPGSSVHCIEDVTSTCPSSLYSAAKHGFHLIAAAWAEQAGVALAWGRIFNVYGPHEHPSSLVGTLARGLLNGEEVCTSDGRQVRDYIYVVELAGALTALLRSDATGSFNLASGIPVQVAEIISAIAIEVGRPELVRMGAQPQRPREPGRLTAEVQRLRESTGWSPSIRLREGVSLTVDWWKGTVASAVDVPQEVPAHRSFAAGLSM
jgi:nucleoside-diphosphate-sugar epimerase